MRRIAKVSLGAVVGAGACIAVAIGGVDGASLLRPHVGLPQAMLAAGLLVAVVVAVIRRVQFVPPSARAQRVSMWLAAAGDLADLELVLALVAGTYALIAMTGGVQSPAYPIAYALVAFAASVLARPGAIATVGAATCSSSRSWFALDRRCRRSCSPACTCCCSLVPPSRTLCSCAA